MTLGRRSLLAVLQRTRAREVAARCRVTPSAVSRWATGQRVPRERERQALQRCYGITPHTWDVRVSTGGVHRWTPKLPTA